MRGSAGDMEQVVESGLLRMRLGTLHGWKSRYFELGEEVRAVI